jgi:hypothetical protein
LAAELLRILDEYQRLWLLRNRPGGLADSVAVFAPLLKLYVLPFEHLDRSKARPLQ